MLARTKAADKHVAHYTWVGHDSGRLDTHGGLPWEMLPIQDMCEDKRECMCDGFGALEWLNGRLCLCLLGSISRRLSIRATCCYRSK